jgi:CheY-like chemotaxis protein
MTIPDRPLILLVDDFEDALDIYGEYFAHHGYHVVVARNGQEAVDQARALQPDVILLDLRMPIMSGQDAVRVLREDPTFSGVPIIALTAHALAGERVDAMVAGFDDVIAKPCLPDDLLARVKQILGASETSASE